jgi:ABC-type multidrug transport system fused ATPase/permease subunit
MVKIQKLFALLSTNEKKSAFVLLIMILISAILDVIGLASIMPLIALLSNPDFIKNNSIINNVYNFFDFRDPKIFLFYTCLFYFLFFLFSMVFKAVTIYLQLRFSLMCEYSIGRRLLKNYLYQPYAWFLDRHSSDLAKNILSAINQIINQAFLPTFNFVAQGLVSLFITLFLIYVNPKLSLIVGLTLGFMYTIIYKFFSSKLNLIGKERVKNDQDRFTAVSNAFGAIKETKIGNLEDFYTKVFSGPAKKFAKNQSSALIIGQLPKYILEAIAFGGLLLIILYLMKESDNFTSTLPILSLYIFAGYKLMPALQQLYLSLTSLRYVNPVINSLDKDRITQNHIEFSKNKLNFEKYISLENISYRYPKSFKNSLDNISIKIPIRTTVGLIGTTGSGKTTIVDLILGLLDPHEGNIKIDNIVLDRTNLNSWQKNIGYVPQQIFLTDQSISANIAFGVESDLIDHQAVEYASKIANLHDFVNSELKEKYDTIIGERGIRLSGGQRQRIGIARALYHKPKVLVLDEATNSLDNLTEQAVMEAVYNLSNKITIILIAHRISTIKKCDQVFLMSQGRIITSGNYNELSKFSKEFKKFIS